MLGVLIEGVLIEGVHIESLPLPPIQNQSGGQRAPEQMHAGNAVMPLCANRIAKALTLEPTNCSYCLVTEAGRQEVMLLASAVSTHVRAGVYINSGVWRNSPSPTNSQK